MKPFSLLLLVSLVLQLLLRSAGAAQLARGDAVPALLQLGSSHWAGPDGSLHMVSSQRYNGLPASAFFESQAAADADADAKDEHSLLNQLRALPSAAATEMRTQARRGMRKMAMAAAPTALRWMAKLPPKQQQQALRFVLPLAVQLGLFDSAQAETVSAANGPISPYYWLWPAGWFRRRRGARRGGGRQGQWPEDNCQWFPPFECFPSHGGGAWTVPLFIQQQQQEVVAGSEEADDEPSFETAAYRRICPSNLVLTVDGTCWPLSYLQADYHFRAVRDAVRYVGREELGLPPDEVEKLLLLDEDYLAARDALKRELEALPTPEERQPRIIHVRDVKPQLSSVLLSPDALKWLEALATYGGEAAARMIDNDELTPKVMRFRDLFMRGAVALETVQEGGGGVAELNELKQVQAGLADEFGSYPTRLQGRVRPSWVRTNAALTKVINQLERGATSSS